MTFNSVIFLIFFPLVTFLYFTIPHKYRWFLLLSASIYFYMSFVPKYILILALTILIDYIAGIYLEKSSGQRKKWFLILSLVANGAILFFFKYFGFFDHNLDKLATLLHWRNPIPDLKILLPIGLSFHTFQSMSYTIEVYRGHQKAEKNFGIFALYVMFYPQLVAGPIERPQNLLHQFYEKHEFSLQRLGSGLRLMVWGFFKKIFIADRLAVFANQVFNNVYDYHGISLLIAVIFFAFQIYCDFSGYSDIAIGAAEVMGFKLMKNFDRPYISQSISEFWKRWHISLSTWFKDYVYIPLGGSRVGLYRLSFNLLITFLISGLWHGAKWTFVFWGLLNGIYLVVGNFKNSWFRKINFIGLKKFPTLNNIWQICSTFFLTCFAWIFFRANTFNDAFYIIKNIFTGWDNFARQLGNQYFIHQNIYLEQYRGNFALAIIAIAILLISEYFRDKTAAGQIQLKPWLRNLICIALVFLIFGFGEFKDQQFIYFQF